MPLLGGIWGEVHMVQHLGLGWAALHISGSMLSIMPAPPVVMPITIILDRQELKYV